MSPQEIGQRIDGRMHSVSGGLKLDVNPFRADRARAQAGISVRIPQPHLSRCGSTRTASDSVDAVTCLSVSTAICRALRLQCPRQLGREPGRHRPPSADIRRSRTTHSAALPPLCSSPHNYIAVGSVRYPLLQSSQQFLLARHRGQKQRTRDVRFYDTVSR